MRRLSLKEFIEKAQKVHGKTYDYSKVEYVNNRTKIKIICPEHGEFLMCPDNHINGKQGCPICGTKSAQAKNRMQQNDFIERAKQIHNEKYDYSKSKYVNTDTKVCIICPEHGEFWQAPHHHLNGIGCPKCGRKDITETLLYEDIKKEFPDAIHTYRPDFLFNNGKPQSIDIFIPSLNIGIEYQGRQHFVPISKYGGKEELIRTQNRDIRKFQLCKKNGLKLFYVSYEKETPNQYLSHIYKNKKELFEAIKHA